MQDNFHDSGLEHAAVMASSDQPNNFAAVPPQPSVLGKVVAATVAASLSGRALCPDCVRLGGCKLGLPGLLPLPAKGEVDSILGKTATYLRDLIKCNDSKALVQGFQLLSREGAGRGETYIGGASLCALIRKSELQPNSKP